VLWDTCLSHRLQPGRAGATVAPEGFPPGNAVRACLLAPHLAGVMFLARLRCLLGRGRVMGTARAYVFAICISLVMLAVVGCGEDKPTDSGDNTAPVAAFAVSPGLGGTEVVFQFDASGCSDAEDTVSLLEVRWDWENDGWDTDWSTTKTASHQYGTQGNKTVKLEVRDTGGMTDDTTQAVDVSGISVPPMVLVPSGTFEMGDGVALCGAEHQVTLTWIFYLGKYEVTNQEYRDALQWAYDHNPRLATVSGSYVFDAVDGSTALLLALGPEDGQISFSGDTFNVASGYEDHPATGVTWYGAAAYCDWLSLQAGLTKAYDHSTWQCDGGNPYTAVGYRLPTDAEWEYATQYGGERIYPWGDESPDCSRANWCGGSPDWTGSAVPVGSYPGWTVVEGDSIYDMAGNVWEWCNDWWICDLGTTPMENPAGPASGSFRILHGGSWVGSDGLRCAFRGFLDPSSGGPHIGFRCARSQ